MSETRVVTSQAEWEALPRQFAAETVIEIRALHETVIISRIPGSSRVVARGSSSVVARGSSSVVARESSSVVAWGSSSVVARGSSRVVARESSSVEARESSSVVAWESSSVEAWESSSVVARESSRVVAWGSSSVEAWESSSVEAWGSSSVEARESSSVEARESSSVVARESSRVVAWGQSSIHQKSAKSPEIHGQSVCFVYDGYGVPIRKSDTATIIQVLKIDGVDGWLEAEGIVRSEGVAVLYKRVSRDFLTQEKPGAVGKKTTWAIGEVKTHPAWDPSSDECGAGKFHACSRPYFCDEFRNEKGDRHIAIRVAVTDLYAWPNPSYPHKIAFRECVVLHECDRWGSPLTQEVESVA